MTTETPTVGYYSLLANTPSNTSTAYSWTSAPGQVSVPGVVQMTTADVLHAGLAAVGLASVTVPITISLAPDTAAITVNEGMSGLAVGMILAPSTSFYAISPNGLQIIDVNTDAGTILCGGKDAMADFLGGMTVEEMTALNDGLFVNGGATFNDFPYLAVDQYPYGTLGVELTPSSGVTVTGYNYDGGQVPNPEDNGTAMSNSGGQALAGCIIAFENEGTYEIAAAYTSNDENYSDATASTLTVEVSAA